jgi:hypothetical protein
VRVGMKRETAMSRCVEIRTERRRADAIARMLFPTTTLAG